MFFLIDSLPVRDLSVGLGVDDAPGEFELAVLFLDVLRGLLRGELY